MVEYLKLYHRSNMKAMMGFAVNNSSVSSHGVSKVSWLGLAMQCRYGEIDK